MKLNQLIAVSQGEKQRLEATLKHGREVFSNAHLFSGRQRTYVPKNDDGTVYPGENERIQQTVEAVLVEAMDKFEEVIDFIASQDETNTIASADVIVDGKVVLQHVPSVTLIALAKYLMQLGAQVNAIPILDSTTEWSRDHTHDRWESAAIGKYKTAKVQKAVVLYDATPEHPAQTQLVSQDVIEGTWFEKKFSTAWTVKQRRDMYQRIKALHDAVVVAREAANMTDISERKLGEQILTFINTGTNSN